MMNLYFALFILKLLENALSMKIYFYFILRVLCTRLYNFFGCTILTDSKFFITLIFND